MSKAFLFKKHGSAAIYNMYGDYSYLTAGYYQGLDCELAGLNVKPTVEEALDAYVVPLAMKKAELANIKIPKYEIVTEKVAPPVLAFPVNPFTTKHTVIKEPEEAKAKISALTMGGKYAALCQQLPADYRLAVVRSIFGITGDQEFAEIAGHTFRVFQIPLMKIQVIISGGSCLFSAIEPLPFKELDKQELDALEVAGTWQK